ncbi:hypothetical protein ACIHFD_57435 [Nonomuraea sp. NPDC051941]|uniref:hypothetical protein n=1 Tax=Nonomuraea sp. NPDC051941 TaxID=3364373 RepID=UPI0037C93376
MFPIAVRLPGVPGFALPSWPLPPIVAVRGLVWVVVLVFVVALVALGVDPVLALGVALAALSAAGGDRPLPPLNGR